MKHDHGLIIKAVDQRNEIRKQQAKDDETSPTQDSVNRSTLKLKGIEPWSSHQRAWAFLGLSALMGMRGYTEYQNDPENSKLYLYLGGTFGGAFLVTSVYFFHKAYNEYTDAKKVRSQSFDINDQSSVSNTWVAPSLIDRDWGLAIGFQF